MVEDDREQEAEGEDEERGSGSEDEGPYRDTQQRIADLRVAEGVGEVIRSDDDAPSGRERFPLTALSDFPQSCSPKFPRSRG